MSAREFEAFLTQIYVDASARARFKANPRAEGRRAGLSEEECSGLENTNWADLELAAGSYAHKRLLKRGRGKARSIRLRLQSILAAFR